MHEFWIESDTALVCCSIRAAAMAAERKRALVSMVYSQWLIWLLESPHGRGRKNRE